MKMHVGMGVLLVAACCCLTARAGTVPGAIGSSYMNPADWLQRITIGVDGEQINREVDPDDGEDVALDVLAVSAYIGYDINETTTIFGTLGGAEDNAGEGGDSGIKFSAGANFNLAKFDVRQSAGMVGDRVTFRLVPELASYDADTTDWWGVSVALPIAYEMVEGDTYFSMQPQERLVLAFYAGPQISWIQGSMDNGGDFDATQLIGVVGGIDFYMTPVATIGGRVEYFGDDEVSGGGSLRYHF